MMRTATSLDDLPGDACEGCGAPLRDDRRAGAIYCSRTCRRKHLDRLEKEGRAAARAGLTCHECGRKFDGARAGQMYCSRTCTRLAMRKRTWGIRRCEICDDPFLPNHKRQARCSTETMECVRRLKTRLAEALRARGSG